MDQLEVRAEEAGNAGALRLKFKGPLRQLIGSVRKPQGSPCQPGSGGEPHQNTASPSHGAAGVSGSPGHPVSPSSAEPSPVAGAEAMQPGPAHWPGTRSIHGQPPGKQPYPDDRTPEAEAVRAQLQQRPESAAAAAPAGGSDGGPPAAGAGGGGSGGAAAAHRSVHAQPPGKQPHPDDPAFSVPSPAAAVKGETQREAGTAALHSHLGHLAQYGGAGVPGVGSRSVYGQPPGKQPDQIARIEEAAGHVEEDEEPLSPVHPQAGPAVQAPWQQQQQQHALAPAGHAPVRTQQHTAAAAAHGAQPSVPAPAASSHKARQRSAPAAPGGGGGTGGGADKPSSRKRPASHAAGDGGQRKKAANGAAGGGGPTLQRLNTGASTSRPFNTGVPASLARSGSFAGEGGVQQIRPMPGAPRSLQQRQQLLNGATGGARPAGASRPKQGSAAAAKPAAGATKPKSQAKAPGSSQKRPAAGAAPAASAHHYKPGDVVWAKIGVYPWWPAQLQRPTADEHFKPKHAPTDLFCVFYGSNDYNWLPPSALKPFTETHPDYTKHASIKNKALQRAIDEAWVYGVQRQRPDVHYGPGYAGGS